MAPRSSTRKPDPPVHSSSDEEEEEISSGGEEEEEEIQKRQKKELGTTKAALKEKAKSESESESESETESEDANVEPIASSKPMDHQGTPSKSVKPKSKTSTTSTVVSGKGTAKRGSQVERDAKDSKRAKDSKSNGALDKEMENHVSSKEIPKLYRGVGVSMEDFVIKTGLDMQEGKEKLGIEQKWAKLHMDELELFVRRNELMLEQAKRIFAGYKSV